jgi:hypothetical protein
MNVDQLKAFNPGGFTAAASAFEGASTGANSSQSSLSAAGGTMGGWSGPAASAVTGTLSDMRDALSPAPSLLEGAQQVLESFVVAVTVAQDKLNSALGKAESLGCQVAPDGTVTPPAQPPGQPPQVCYADPTQEAARVKAQNAYDNSSAVKNWNDATQQAPALQSAIQGALQNASQADSRAGGDLARASAGAKAFTQVAGGNLGAPLTNLTSDKVNLQTDGARWSQSFAAQGFFWPTLGGAIDSEWTGGTIGLGEGLLKRYRNTELVLPITEDANNDLAEIGGKVADNGDSFTMAGRLLVPKGSSADPLVQEVQDTTSGKQWTQPGKGTLVPDEDTLEAAAPEWASGLGKGLGYGGAALTLYSTGADQWQYDAQHHPNWSTLGKVADATQATAVVGGSQVGGAWVGAESGAEGGAAIGEMIDPLGGGVIGGVVGGVAGGLVGGGVGKVVGDDLEKAGSGISHVAGQIGSGIAHGASKLWNAVF